MIKPLQSLRGIFAILIFLFHYGQPDGTPIFPYGCDGYVAFFMLLSGYVMSMAYSARFEDGLSGYGNFIAKRTARIYPLHLLCLLAFLCLSRFDVGIEIIPNLLLLQSWIPVHKFYFSGNTVSWFLCCLMFFYVLFPMLVRAMREHIKWFYVFYAIYFIALAFVPEDMATSLVYVNPAFRIFDFMLGMLLWQYLNRQNSKPENSSWLQAVSIVLFIGAYFVFPHVPATVGVASLWWLPLAVMIAAFRSNGGVLGKIMSWKPLVLFGDVSFSFYMIHKLAIWFFHILFDHIGITMDYYAQLAIILAATIVLSFACYHLFERPVTKWLYGKIQSTPAGAEGGTFRR